MNSSQIPPPPRAGTGCLGIGCLSFLGFFLFLALATVGGGFLALHHVRKTYSSAEPLPLPAVEETQSAVIETTPVPVPVPPPVATTPNETALPATTPSAPVRNLVQGPVEQRWKAFEKAGKRGEKARIELSAGDINTLLAQGKNTRGRAFVTIEENVGRVQVSIPLKGVVLMNGRYLNGEATVRAARDGEPARAEITNLVVGSASVPDEFLDRRIFGWSSIRGLITNWLDDHSVASFRIENNRVIGETR